MLSADNNFNSHWMTFDIATQNWTFFMNDLNFGRNCCYGNMLTLRNVHYYFSNGVPDGSSQGLLDLDGRNSERTCQI